jgi:hypothetical protein
MESKSILFAYSEAVDNLDTAVINAKRERFLINQAIADRPDVCFSAARLSSTSLFSALVNCNKPTILHLSSHGSTQGVLFEEMVGGPTHVARTDELTRFYTQCGRGLQLVVLAACNSETLGRDACLAVPHVIASTCKIEDEMTVNFMSRFYSILASGGTVKEAFQLSCDRVTDYTRQDRIILYTGTLQPVSDPPYFFLFPLFLFSFILLPLWTDHNVPLLGQPRESSLSPPCPSNLPAKPVDLLEEPISRPLQSVR